MPNFAGHADFLPRFQIFAPPSHDAKYVLRDNNTETDYPFDSRAAARRAIKIRIDSATRFIGSPSSADSYGIAGRAPLESAA